MPSRLEQGMSTGAGKVKAATARVKGLTGVFNHLAQEHGEGSSLLKSAKAATDPSKQKDLWSKLRTELLAHERGELLGLYSEFERHEATREIAQRHRAEADDLEIAIGNVDRADFGTPRWKARLTQLEQLLKEHVDEEEHEFFPTAQDALDKATIDDLQARFGRAKKAFMHARHRKVALDRIVPH